MPKEPTYKGTFFEQFVDEGYQIGWQQGRLEGRQQGHLEGQLEGRQEGIRLTLQADLLEYLSTFWPDMPLDLTKAAVQNADGEALSAALRVVWCSSDSPEARRDLIRTLMNGTLATDGSALLREENTEDAPSLPE